MQKSSNKKMSEMTPNELKASLAEIKILKEEEEKARIEYLNSPEYKRKLKEQNDYIKGIFKMFATGMKNEIKRK